MTDTASTNGVGTPKDALDAVLQGAIDGARHAPAPPAPDPRVAAAFALGWQMAELYRPGPMAQMQPAAESDLPGLGRLEPDDRGQISILQVRAALAKLTDAVTAAKLTMPDPTKLFACFDGTATPDAQAAAVRDLHVQLLATLTAADFRLGKAYGLGRALADTCRISGEDGLAVEFGANRIALIRSWLDDLATAFPPHAAKSVSASLAAWAAGVPAGGDVAGALAVLDRQGQLWRSLLSGEKSSLDMLATSDYLTAADRLLQSTRRLVLTSIKRFPVLVTAIVVLFAGGVALMWASGSSGSIAAGAAGILASAGLTWKGLGSSVGGLVGRLEQHLWGAELDGAVATATTLWPATAPVMGDVSGRGHSQKLARLIGRDAAAGTGVPPKPVSHTVEISKLAAVTTPPPPPET